MGMGLVLWCVWLSTLLRGGTAAVFDQYYTFENSTFISLPDEVYISGAFTLEMWVKPTNDPPALGTILFSGGSANSANSFMLVYTPNRFRFTSCDSNALCSNNIQELGSPQVGIWTHMAISWDAVFMAAIVVNGSLVATFSSHRTLTAVSRTPVQLGTGFAGHLEEFRIWSTMRYESDIRSTMNISLVGNEAGLRFYNRYDECSGTSIVDSGPSGLNGTVVLNVIGTPVINGTWTCAPTPVPTAAPTASPTAQPSAAPTAAPTAQPTAVPSSVPTAQPTAVSTAQPSAVPTAAPTARPTAGPTAAPTAVPSIGPTALPTVAPSAVPTTSPTAAPTAQPTPAPTALTCLMGQFTNSTPACQTCAAGTYTNSTSATVCTSCALGYIAASSGATGCVACTAGRTANVTGMSGCLDCTAGYFAAASAATTCDICVSGGNATSCTVTLAPTAAPTAVPSTAPTPVPTSTPTAAPTASPTVPIPTADPTAAPTAEPTTASPTAEPTLAPSAVPSVSPTPAPTWAPVEETVLLVDNATTVVLVANGGITATATVLDFTPCGDRTGWVTRYVFDLVGTFGTPIKVRVQSTERQRRIHKERVLSVCPDSDTGWIPAHTYSCPDIPVLAPVSSGLVLVESRVCHNTPFGVQEPEIDGKCYNLPRRCQMCDAGTRGCNCEYDSTDVYGSSERAAYSVTGIVFVVISLLFEALHEELRAWHKGESASDLENEGLLTKKLDSVFNRPYFPFVSSALFALGWFLVVFPVATDMQNAWSTGQFNTTEFRGFWLTFFALSAVLHLVRAGLFFWTQRNKLAEWWWVWVVSVVEALAWVGVLLFPYVSVEETYGSASNVPKEWQSLYYAAMAWALEHMVVAGTVTAPARRAAPFLAVVALTARVVVSVALGITWSMVVMRLPCE